MKRTSFCCAVAALALVAVAAVPIGVHAGRGPTSAPEPAGPPAPNFYSFFARPTQPAGADDLFQVALSNEERKTADGKPAGAMIEVRVPANAQFWFDGTSTTQTGAIRHFISPPLTPGKTYTYTVRVRWVAADGVVYDMTRQLEVEAGRETVAGITEPPVTSVAAPIRFAEPASSPNKRLMTPPRSR